MKFIKEHWVAYLADDGNYYARCDDSDWMKFSQDIGEWEDYSDSGELEKAHNSYVKENRKITR